MTSQAQGRNAWIGWPAGGKGGPSSSWKPVPKAKGMKSHEQGEKEKGASRATVEIDAFPRTSRRKGRFHSIVGLLHKDHSVTL